MREITSLIVLLAAIYVAFFTAIPGKTVAATEAWLDAQVGTHPKGGDAKQAPGASLSDAVAKPCAKPL